MSASDAASRGGGVAFDELVAPYTRELHLHCYRMLGSIPDAEDVLQEVLVAAWRGLGDFAGRSSIRTWLYRIATNRCLNAIRADKRRRPVEPIPPFEPPEPTRRGEITWLQPYPDSWLAELTDADGPPARYERREAVELAFVEALQRLPPRQTAALLLCDVLGYSLADTAAMLDASATAIKGSLQRARATLDRHRGSPATRVGRDDRAEAALARRFAAAFTADDIDAVLALLTDDAWLAMPPAPHEYVGGDAIGSFLRASAGWAGRGQVRLVETRANGQPAFGVFFTVGSAPARPAGIIVLTITGSRIRGITRFLDADLPTRFGLEPARAERSA